MKTTKFPLLNKRIDFELFAWLGGLILLFLLDPSVASENTLCLFKNLGIPCPGCGIGRSIAFALEGNWMSSLEMHPLGIIALVILLSRITQLVYKNFNQF